MAAGGRQAGYAKRQAVAAEPPQAGTPPEQYRNETARRTVVNAETAVLQYCSRTQAGSDPAGR